jgi:hypothetical protein
VAAVCPARLYLGAVPGIPLDTRAWAGLRVLPAGARAGTLYQDAERALSLSAMKKTPLRWKHAVTVAVRRTHRLAWAEGVLVFAALVAAATHAVIGWRVHRGLPSRNPAMYYDVFAGIFALAGIAQGCAWLRERRARRDGARVCFYGVNDTRLVCIAAEGSGTQAWSVGVADITRVRIEGGASGLNTAWVEGPWTTPDGPVHTGALPVLGLRDAGRFVADVLHRSGPGEPC